MEFPAARFLSPDKKRAVPESTAKFREETSKNVQRKPPYGRDIGSALPHCKIIFLQRSKMAFYSINQRFSCVASGRRW